MGDLPFGQQRMSGAAGPPPRSNAMASPGGTGWRGQERDRVDRPLPHFKSQGSPEVSSHVGHNAA